MQLVFNWIDDEHCEVWLFDGYELQSHIITMDHGPHGWDGMIGIRDALLKTAEISGWGVAVNGEPGI